MSAAKKYCHNFCFLLGFTLTLNTLAVNFSSAQNIDSLIAESNKVQGYEKALIQKEIGQNCYNNYQIDSALYFFSLAVKNTPQDSLSFMADLFNKIARTYYKVEDVTNTLIYYKKAAKLFEIYDVTFTQLPYQYALVGRTFYDMADYDSAMVYYLKAKKIYEQEKIINVEYGYLLHFIGSVYKRQDKMDKACEYYDMELEYGKKHGFKSIEAEGLYLKGDCIDNDEELLANDFLCLKMYQELENEKQVALMYQLISGDYRALGKRDSALYYSELSLKIFKGTNDITAITSTLHEIAKTLIELERFREAEDYLNEAVEYAQITGVKKHIRFMEIYNAYYRLYYDQGKYKEAIDNLLLMYAYSDSSRNEQYENSILEMELVYNDEKQKAEIELLNKDNILAEKEKKLAQEETENQAFITKFFIGGSAVLLLLGIFILIKYRESQKQKALISEQKQVMEFQKRLVEEKNKDITDSLVYASSIQKAIITSDEYFSDMFDDFFVIYRPRDIVSGDFYWAYHMEDGKKLIAVGDCTGHGVPGAMMSMLGTAFLNDIIIEGKNTSPEIVLSKMREQVKKALQHNTSKDGMDMSFCCIENNTLTFAGANLPVYILRNGELTEIKGEKQPIGYQPIEEKPFVNHEVQLEKGDQIYLFSDGYADQFGGEKGKKYKYKTFRDKLKRISSKNLKQQREIINTEFDNWKGDLEQLDDVCVVGFQI